MTATARKIIDFVSEYQDRADYSPSTDVIDLPALSEAERVARTDVEREPDRPGDKLVHVIRAATDAAHNATDVAMSEETGERSLKLLCKASDALCRLTNAIYPILKRENALLTGSMWNQKSARLAMRIGPYVPPQHRAKIAEILESELTRGIPDGRLVSDELKIALNLYRKPYNSGGTADG